MELHMRYLSLVFRSIGKWGIVDNQRDRRRLLTLIVARVAFASIIVTIASPAYASDKAEELIESLASPNRAPHIDEGSPPHYPRTYDRTAQAKIVESQTKLLSMGTKAFTQLIANVEDRRYSSTEQRGKTLWVNLDVGYVCRHIVELQVEVYQSSVNLPPRERYWLPFDRMQLEEWWKQRQTTSLRDIQLEGVKWALIRQKAATHLDDRRRMKYVERLEGLVRRLESSNDPIVLDLDGDFRTGP
jgi:hypothetical protein